MKRRDFMKRSLALGSTLLMPSLGYSAILDSNAINFSNGVYSNNGAQTIIVFMYGGASQLGGNLSNLSEISQYSQSSYADYFRDITPTASGCWQEAGGGVMEELIAAGDMTLYRSCYSQIRENEDNKAHGLCTSQNQRGTFDINGGGVVANIANILHAKGMVNDQMLMPFVTMEGESTFYLEDTVGLPGYLKPVGVDKSFNNPYERDDVRRWEYYTELEQEITNYNHSDAEGGFDPQLTKDMDALAQSKNGGKIKEAFGKRQGISDFIKGLKQSSANDNHIYAANDFSPKIKAAVTLLDKNPDTKIITLGTDELGSWDDHNNSRDYVGRMENLFQSLKSAMNHLKAIGKDGKINIMVFGEFGRNVNLNTATGWDHGNLQNYYVLGGKDYFNHRGIVGETIIENAGTNRLWLKPKTGTYSFEPISIAATLYHIYGITNPNVLTGGNFPPVNIIT